MPDTSIINKHNSKSDLMNNDIFVSKVLRITEAFRIYYTNSVTALVSFRSKH